MMTDITLNGVALSDEVPAAYVLAVRRPLVAARRHVTVAIPGRAGSWIFPEEPGDRPLEVILDIQADTFDARRAAVRSLADWSDVGVVANLILDDEPDRYHTAILDDAPPVEEWLNNGTVALRFLTGPYALATVVSSETIAATASPTSRTFAGPDSPVVALPVIEVTANGGALTDLEISLNDDTITWSGDVAAGEKLTISTVTDTVTLGANGDTELTGAYDATDVDMADVSGAFPFIVPGTNDLEVTWSGGATSLTIAVRWRERFR